MTTLYSQTTVQINGATCDAFVSAELKGDLTEVPGVGRAAVAAFTNAGIDDTKALLRQFLKLRKVGMSVQEWQNAMAQYLETIGVIAHRSGVVYVCSTRLLSKHRGNRVRQRERRAAESKVNKGGTSKFCIGILIIIATVALLVWCGPIRATVFGEEGEGTGRTATLAEVLRLMQTGDRRMQDGDCEAARTSYVEAMSVARAGKFADVVTIVEWKLYKAQSCLGSAVLPLPGPEVKDPTCGIKALKDEELLADFEKAASKGGERRVKHWGRWFKLFGVSKHSCSKRELSRGYRTLMLK